MVELFFFVLIAVGILAFDRISLTPQSVVNDTQRQLFIKNTANKAKTLYIDPSEYAYFLSYCSGLSPEAAKLCIDVMNTANSTYVSQLYGVPAEALLQKIQQIDMPLWQLEQFEKVIYQVYALSDRIDNWGLEYYLERVLNKYIAYNQKLARVANGSQGLPIDVYEDQAVS